MYICVSEKSPESVKIVYEFIKIIFGGLDVILCAAAVSIVF